jgi:hypothetical protein
MCLTGITGKLKVNSLLAIVSIVGEINLPCSNPFWGGAGSTERYSVRLLANGGVFEAVGLWLVFFALK